MKTIFIATGGTGGHITPARCLAKKLAEENIKTIILGDYKYKSYIKQEDRFASFIISASQLNKGLAMVKTAFKIGLGVLQSFYYFLRYQPSHVVAFGGYSTFPVLITAIIFKKKIILHEQNAHLGKVNRLFAKYADKIALTFENTTGIASEFQKKTTVVGNLVREEILALNKKEYILPKKLELPKRDKMGYDVILNSEIHDYYNFKPEIFNILVLGGSGGAKIFSEILPKAFFNLSTDIKNHIHVTQQCRADLVSETFKQYEKFNISITISHFFEDMKSEIEKAHLVIARSGSSSLAEFLVAKKPMILIPFAASADDHQMKNAKIVENSGAALIIKEEDFTINKISETITKLYFNQNLLKEMSANTAKIANLHATQNLIKLL